MDSGNNTGELVEMQPNFTEKLEVPSTDSRDGSTENLIVSMCNSIAERLGAEAGDKLKSTSNENLAGSLSASTEVLELHPLNNNGENCPRKLSYGVSRSPRGSYQGGSKSSRAVLKILEVFFLSAIVLALFGLYMIPTVFFVNPQIHYLSVSQNLLLSSSPSDVVR